MGIISSQAVRWARAALLSLVVLAPPSLFMVHLPRMGHLQYNDYYGVIGQVVEVPP